MRHYRWTQIGMDETTFAIAEPDTYVKSLDMGARVDEVKRKEATRIRRGLLDAIGTKRDEWSLAKPLGEEITKSRA